MFVKESGDDHHDLCVFDNDECVSVNINDPVTGFWGTIYQFLRNLAL